ncbi:TonB-dependent receptor [Anaeromyxobacter terrae]|uniref:TonB-dependent receptor n=1 Tax=Anaeromyxobacter terrae TaxID=2925406 RepID=UPI001F59FF5D|nr:TonB-dependent receptor [Anaeromyxobacter sp. SG22]
MRTKFLRLSRIAPLALLLAGVASAQETGVIIGVVTDGATGKPVAGALVVATSPALAGEKTGVTDGGGNFRIEGLPPGQYRLAVQLEGYRPAERADIAVRADTTIRATLAVVPAAVKLEEVVVTGTRIRRKDLTTPAPVTVISREQVQASGKLSVGEYLQSLPEQGGAINAQVNNGGDGSTQISLRTLGSNRTLVLVNGHRFTGLFNGGGVGDVVVATDLNAIPIAAIERIEVLKDGASAIYGSDAIAGVVNVITRKDFSGIEANTYGGTSSRGDGRAYDINATAGTTSDSGSLLFAAGYFYQGPVFAGDRTFSTKIYSLDFKTGEKTFSGSSAIPAGRFRLDPTTCNTAACRDLKNQGITGPTNLFVDPSMPGGARPYDAEKDPYNFNPANYLYTPQERISLYSTGFRKLADFARAYYQASYVNRQSRQQLAPEPLFTVNNGVSVSKDSLYNPYGVDLSDVRRRLVEFGPRSFRQDIDTMQLIGGLEGTLPDLGGPVKGWSWDVNLNFSRAAGISTTDGTLRVPKIAAAIGPSMIDPATGKPICVTTPGDVKTVITGCTPLNLLGGAGSITPDQVAGLGFLGTDRTRWQILDVQATLTGEIFRIVEDRPVALALGYEGRREFGASEPNPISGAFENSGNNFALTKGGFTVNEGYVELSAPLLGNLPFAENLEATAATRVFHYSTFGTDNTYKVGLRYSPFSDITVRGTYSQGFRAPSILELFQGVADNFPTISDPCNGLDPAGNPAPITDPVLLARCGNAANNGDDRTQQKSRNGGNPNLKPETADIYTAGLVFQPRYVPNLSLTLDYFNIKIDNSISTIGADVIIRSCYSQPTQKFCEFVHRTPGGLIDFIDDLAVNIGGESAAGIDAAVRYDVPTATYGRFNFLVDGSWLQKHNKTLADGTVIKAKGTSDLYFTVGYLPEFKLNAGVAWGRKNFGAGVSTRWVSSVKECGTSEGASGNDGLCYLDSTYSRRVSAWNSWDAFVSYVLPSTAGRTSLAFGVQNVFDTKPPTAYDIETFPSDPRTYDFMGRFFYVRLGHRI